MAAPKLVRWDDSRYRGRGTLTQKYLVWHCTAGGTAQSSREWLNRPNVPRNKQASYHYIIDRDGTIYRHTPLEAIAFHAGASQWPVPPGGVQPRQSLNGVSLGIAFANRNDGEAITEAQRASALWLAVTLMKRFNIPWQHNLGHREIAPSRKTDPLPTVLPMPAWRQAIKAAAEAGV